MAMGATGQDRHISPEHLSRGTSHTHTLICLMSASPIKRAHLTMSSVAGRGALLDWAKWAVFGAQSTEHSHTYITLYCLWFVHSRGEMGLDAFAAESVRTIDWRFVAPNWSESLCSFHLVSSSFFSLSSLTGRPIGHAMPLCLPAKDSLSQWGSHSVSFGHLDRVSKSFESLTAPLPRFLVPLYYYNTSIALHLALHSPSHLPLNPSILFP